MVNIIDSSVPLTSILGIAVMDVDEQTVVLGDWNHRLHDSRLEDSRGYCCRLLLNEGHNNVWIGMLLVCLLRFVTVAVVAGLEVMHRGTKHYSPYRSVTLQRVSTV